MCGIAGIVDINRQYDLGDISLMLAELHHRGPDNKNFIQLTSSTDDNFIALGHARLSIIDLSEAGNQPMISESGRYTIVFNGEIYNHLQLRQLVASNWRGHSDTETILSCCEKFGLLKTLNLLEGMFAIAIYDKLESILYLARDRYGEKPLFYYIDSKTLLFGSELKSILKVIKGNATLLSSSVDEFLTIGYIKAPNTIFKDFSKLEAGHLLKVDLKDKRKIVIENGTYYDIRSRMTSIIGSNSNLNFHDAKSIFKDKLEYVVKSCLISDVPIGAFLSGGIDSSLIVAAMSHLSSQKIKTYTIGFKDKEYDESFIAKETAAYLGIESNIHYIGIEDYVTTLKELPYFFDEPMADSSQLPTHLLCKFASKSVKVSLSGDGADEVFGGYNHYQFIPKIYSSPLLNSEFFRGLTKSVSTTFNLINNKVQYKTDRWLDYTEKFNKFNKVISAKKFSKFYNNILSADTTSYIKDPNAHDILTPLEFTSESLFNLLAMQDFIYYLPDDVLCKVDRMAMSHSLETRAPFLNHALVELGWSLPFNFKISNGKGKFLLREVLKEYIPEHISEMPKKGFSIPINKLIRENLNEEIEYFLGEQLIKEYNILDARKIEIIKRQHQKRQRNFGTLIYRLLFLQMWCSKWKEKINM